VYRYRYERGRSDLVVGRFLRHRHRLGKLRRIVAKRYRGKYGSREVIMIYGSHGSARFTGTCWGYLGAGPHATRALLVLCGVPPYLADQLAFRSRRREYADLGVDWEYVDSRNHPQFDTGGEGVCLR